MTLGAVLLQSSEADKAALAQARERAFLELMEPAGVPNSPQFKFAMAHIRYVRLMDDQQLAKSAEMLRQSPYCYNDMSARCKAKVVDMILLDREVLGLKSSREDLEILLRPALSQLEAIVGMIQEEAAKRSANSTPAPDLLPNPAVTATDAAGPEL